MTEQMTRRRTSPAVLLFSIVVPAAIIVGVLYFLWVQKPRQQAQESTHAAALRTFGLASPVRNALDARFADGNGDLVADGPADAKACIDPPKLYFSYVALEDPKEYQDAFKDFLA